MADETTAVSYTTPENKNKAAELAAALSLPLTGIDDQRYPYLLVLTEQRVELRGTAPNAPGAVYVDFAGGASQYRRRQGGGFKQTIARAIGVKAGVSFTVLDATTGLGRDSFVFASLGCRVLMFERNPIVHALLADGIHRGLHHPETEAICRRMRLFNGDILSNAPGKDIEPPQVVYIDPMYPHRSKSALVKKEMRFLRKIAGDDPDAAGLIEKALMIAAKKVVVKRPKTAPPLSNRKPDFAVASRNTRYDIYLVKPGAFP